MTQQRPARIHPFTTDRLFAVNRHFTRSIAWSLSAVLLACSQQLTSAEESAATKFAAHCKEARAEAKAKQWFAVQGDSPEWLFLARELEHLGHGEFWKKAGADGLPDSFPIIVKYHEELKKKGIELLLVPVPAKAAMVPEKLQKGASRGEGGVFPSTPFYKKLRAAGVNVLDLEPIFEKRIAAGDKLYCEQDTHWTPLACELVAAEIHAKIKDQPWAAAKSATSIVRGNSEKLFIKGDLAGERLDGMGEEKLQMVKAGKMEGGKIVPVPASDDSPVILLGDSHTLVFSEGGEMHCTAAGLPDHLQQQLGFPLSLVAVKASGADSARVRLIRDFSRKKPGYLAGKKLLIWCFAAREFTLGKWRPIPPG